MKITLYKIFLALITAAILIPAGSLNSQRRWNNSASGNFDATFITDTEPPEIHNCPSNITSYTGSHSTNCSASVTWTEPTATDNYKIESFLSNYAPGASFPVGTTTVTYTAKDPAGNTTTCPFTVTVRDNTAPNISVTLSTYRLWPPNHRMVNITATVRVNDNCSSGSSLDWVLESITSNEDDDGYGDGDTSNDIQNATYNTRDLTFSLRRERSGRGNDRIYTITYKATDAAGNVSRASATVTVPHNQ